MVHIILAHAQKNLFLDLCIYAVVANQEMNEDEISFINQYCDEMNFTEIRYTAQYSVDEAIEKLIEISERRELRIVILELTALVMCDGNYDDSEKEFINKIASAANITEVEKTQIHDAILDLFYIYEKIEKLMN